MHAGRIEVGVDAAGAPALRAIMAGGTPVDGARENRQARGDAGDLNLVASHLDHALVAARRGRRQKLSVGRILDAFLGSEDADQFFGFVVVGRQLFVGDGPIEALAIAAVGLEIVRPHAQRDAAVMVGAAAQHARAPPHKVGTCRIGVGLARHLPTAQQRGVEIAERLLLSARRAMRRVVGPLKHLGLLGSVVPSAGFQHADLGAGQRQDVRGNAAARPGTDHHYVVCFGSCFNLRHSDYFTPSVMLRRK